MNYFIFLYLVNTISSLDISLSSVSTKDIEEIPKLNNTLYSLIVFCKSITNNEQTKNNSEFDIHQTLYFDHQENCCIHKIPNVLFTGLSSCTRDTYDVRLYIKYHKVMTYANRTEASRNSEQTHNCLHTTIQSFCESLLSINLIRNKEKVLYLREEKSSDGWLRHRNNNIRHYYSNEKTVIPLKLMISDIMWQSMQSQTCNDSDKTLENSKTKSVKKNLILLAESAPLIPNLPEDINSLSFQEEKLVIKCIIHGFPSPSVEWLKNNSTIIEAENESNLTVIESDNYKITTQYDNLCTTVTTLKVLNTNYSIPANYSCIATNTLGKSYQTFSIDEDLLKAVKLRGKIKAFNMTGFIIGMIPPLLISFYIIIKLGYRSRYAQERVDEQGMNEEPFFVSY